MQSTINDLTEMLDEINAEIEAREKAKKAAEETKTFDIPTEKMISNFDSFMYSLFRLAGVGSYKIEFEEKDIDESWIIKIVNDSCSLHVYQEDGKVTKIEVVSQSITENTNIDNILAGFLAVLTVTNFDYFGDPDNDYETALNKIMSDNQPHRIGNVIYQYTDTRPVFKVISLSAVPA